MMTFTQLLSKCDKLWHTLCEIEHMKASREIRAYVDCGMYLHPCGATFQEGGRDGFIEDTGEEFCACALCTELRSIMDSAIIAEISCCGDYWIRLFATDTGQAPRSGPEWRSYEWTITGNGKKRSGVTAIIPTDPIHAIHKIHCAIRSEAANAPE